MAISNAPIGPPAELSSRSRPESPEVSRATDHHPSAITTSQQLASLRIGPAREEHLLAPFMPCAESRGEARCQSILILKRKPRGEANYPGVQPTRSQHEVSEEDGCCNGSKWPDPSASNIDQMGHRGYQGNPEFDGEKTLNQAGRTWSWRCHSNRKRSLDGMDNCQIAAEHRKA